MLLRSVANSRLTTEQENLRILWHAGEPLAAGIDFYREAFDLTDDVLGGRIHVQHSMQTNANLITSAWCELFRARDVRVGVSLDGPQEIHDANRKTRAARGSFVSVMRGIDLLRRHSVGMSALCVLTDQSIERPDEMFKFFVEGGFQHVAFNVEEIEGPNLRSSLVGGADGLAGARRHYRAFMSRMLELDQANGWPLRIREFVSMAQRMEGRRPDPRFG